MTKKSICDTLRRTCLILAGSFIMAVNLKSFVRAGGLIPGGFNGLTRLIQEISVLLWHWEPPFSVINFILNAVPVVISFKFIGKKFTGYSCLMIVVSGILTDMVPAWPVTEDILLIAIFGGLINATWRNRSGEYDLCFCVSVFLELPDESIKLHCAREAYFNQHGVCTGNAVTLQNVRTCLDKRVEFRFPFWIERHVYKGCNVIPERHWGNTCVIAGDDSAFL